MSRNADNTKKQDVIANRLLIHMAWAFVTAITMMYLNHYYTGLGLIEGMTTVSTAAKILFFVAAAVAVAFSVLAIVMYMKGTDFSVSTFAPAVTVGWPVAYMIFMCPLAFSGLWFWDFSDVFGGVYIIIGTFLALYLIDYLFQKDLFLTAVALVGSEIIFYILSRLMLTAWFGRVLSIVFCIISAAVGVFYIIKLKALADNHGKAKEGKRVFPKTAIYFPAYILGDLHIAGNIACIFFGYATLRYTCYTLAVYAVVVGIIYVVKKLYKK